MPYYDRSGGNLTALKLGYVRCLRQEWLTAGEVYNGNLSGHLDMASLREPISTDVRCDLFVAWTPLRFLWDGWIDYLREGMDTNRTIPTMDGTNVCGPALGIGEQKQQFRTLFRDNYLKVYNWFFKWPDDPDATWPGSTVQSAINDKLTWGLKAVNLPNSVTRLKASQDVGTDDYEQSTAGNKFDIRDLTELRARFKSEQTRDWLASDRYAEIMDEIFHVSVGEDPEERPWEVDHHTAWLRGANIYATDSESLGDRAGVMGIDIDHNVDFAAPEHGLLAWFITLRCPPLFDTEYNPMSGNQITDWAEITGEPELLKAAKPVRIAAQKYLEGSSTTKHFGWEPAAQHFRQGWNVVDPIFKERRSFPTMTASDSTRYHPRMDRIFNTLALGHFWGYLNFRQPCSNPIPEPMHSVMAGD